MQLALTAQAQLPASIPARNAGAGTLTRATTDTEAVASWLARHVGEPATLKSYRKEGERLLMWLASRQLTLQGLTVEDMESYRAFLRSPEPTARWCLNPLPRWLPDGRQDPAWKQVRRVSRTLPEGIPNPAWRPFVGGLDATTVRQAMTIVFGLMEFLCVVGWLRANPLRAAKRQRAEAQADVERYLPREAWQGLLAHIESLPRETKRQQAHYARVRFVTGMLYLLGLRRQELCDARTSHLHQRDGSWWLQVVGKGKKAAPVPLPEDAVKVLREYRESLGLSPWPLAEEDSPLLRDISGKRAIKAGALHALLVAVTRSCPDPTVRKMSAHWLRHTAATHQLDAGVDLLVVRDNLRHNSVTTTERYVHQRRQHQAEQTEKHRL